MAVRPLPLPVTEQTLALRHGIARSSQKEQNYPVCGKHVDISTSKDDAAIKGMHEGCYVLRQMLKQATHLPNRSCAYCCNFPVTLTTDPLCLTDDDWL